MQKELVHLGLKVEAEILRKLQIMAIKESSSVSRIVRIVLADFLKKKGK